MQQSQGNGRVRAALRKRAHQRARHQIDQALAAAHAVAMAEVEAMAREALDEHGRDRVWARRLLRFLDDYGDTLGLFGTPLKLDSADAPAKTDW